MARLGGMSTESFSSARERLFSAASIGLGSILRDQKAMPGTNRMNVLLGLSSQTSPAASRSLLDSPLHSLTSSPIESNGFLDVDDAEALNDEDNWVMDMNENVSIHTLDPLRRHRPLPHAYELGCTRTHINTLSFHGYGPTHTHSQKHGMSRMQQLESPKQAMTMGIDGTRPAAHHVAVDQASGLTKAISSRVGSVRASPQSLSKLSESQSGLQSYAHQALTTVRGIPVRLDRRTLHDSSLQIAERQSAPVNVPNWSKTRKNPTSSAVNFSSIDEIGEDDDEERLPPHEMLARESACNQRMTSSVCEGHGRTLKGRDMRRMRNAVWRQTGFAD